ncbi:MAG: imidazolonepropionase [Deltaproteobacteria bacterium]|nr:imidazolonepropionase [Deltaproteobacteria bacterium]
MPVLANIGLLATCAGPGGQGELHPVPRAAVAWEGETIGWAGPEADLPARWRAEERWDAGGRLVIPGLVDCHTHLCFGGWRADEFADRIRGVGYLEIARRGGGIASTVARTRELSEEALFARAAGFLEEMGKLGVTTVEAKSGYGLDRETELRLLRVHRRLHRETPMRVVSTYLGAHLVPPEHVGQREEYLRLVEELLPLVARERLADAADAYVDEGAFSVAEARRLLSRARALGLDLHLHADQHGDRGGAALAAELGARSADHLEFVSASGIAALAAAGTVAVSLPIAALYLATPPLPARSLVEAGVPVAVSTDFNPGTAPSYHLPLALTLACTVQRLTPAEALKGATQVAARALGLEAVCGSVEAGKSADLAVIDAATPDEWLYHLRPNACVLTVAGGRAAWRA